MNFHGKANLLREKVVCPFSSTTAIRYVTCEWLHLIMSTGHRICLDTIAFHRSLRTRRHYNDMCDYCSAPLRRQHSQTSYNNQVTARALFPSNLRCVYFFLLSKPLDCDFQMPCMPDVTPPVCGSNTLSLPILGCALPPLVLMNIHRAAIVNIHRKKLAVAEAAAIRERRI